MDKKALEQLFASNVFTEETKAAITTMVTEAVNVARDEARKEVAAEFKKNKAKMYEAVEKYIDSRMTGPIQQLQEEAAQVQTLKGQYADKIVSIEESVRADFNNRWKKLVSTLTAVTEREIGELHESEKVNRRAYMKKLNDVETNAASERDAFKRKAALVLENILDIRVQKHLDEHEDDLKAAMKSDFGTELYEAFHSTFRRHFFSTNKEAAKLAGALKEAKTAEKKIVEAANKRIANAEKRATLAESAHKRLVESNQRIATMNRLLAPLKGASRDKMKALLEAAPSADAMQKTFKRFLPEVTRPESAVQVTKKPAQTVTSLHTGGLVRQPVVESAEVDDENELVEIRRRSGLSSQ